MPLLQVRDFPEELYRDLADLAREEHRSIAQQTIHMIKTGLEAEHSRKTRRRLALYALIHDAAVIAPDAPSPADLIREDRDR